MKPGGSMSHSQGLLVLNILYITRIHNKHDNHLGNV